MAIQKVNFTSAQNINTGNTPPKPQVETNKTPETDKEKSNAAKYMLGATAVATVIAAGIMGRKGLLGKNIQKFLGGGKKEAAAEAEKAAREAQAEAEKAAKEAQEKINAESERILKEIEEEPQRAKEALKQSNARNEEWLQQQHEIKEKEYEKMWLNAEKEKLAAAELKHQKEVEEILNTNLTQKSEKELDEFGDMLRKRLDEMRSKGLNWPNIRNKQKVGINLKPEEKEFMQLFDKSKSIYFERLDRESQLLEKMLVKSGDKEVKVADATSYLNTVEQHALGEYYDMYPYNSKLREGVNPKTIPAVCHLDNAFGKAPALKDEAVVYRAVHGSPIYEEQNAFINSLKEGVIIKDPSFVSTSTDATNAQFKQFARSAMNKECGGVLMRIKLPKGTRGIYGGYAEYLLPRNSQIKINKIEVVDGHKIADCEYILP